MADITLDDFPTPGPGHPPLADPGYHHVGGEILADGGHPGDEVPGKGPRVFRIPGLHCSGGEELRGPTLGDLRPVLSAGGTGH